MVPVMGTWMLQLLVLSLQSGVSVRWVTLCSDVFGARKQILLSCCFKQESRRASVALGIHTQSVH